MPDTSDNPQSYFTSFLWPVLCIAVGILRVAFARHTPSNIGWGIALVAVGVLGLVLALMKRPAADQDSVDAPATHASAVEKITNLQRNLYGDLHEYRPATADDFQLLDRAFYDDATRQLTAHGYRLVRDEVNTTIAAATPGTRVVIRSMLGDGGTNTAFIYHVVMRGKAHVIKIVELDTELDDGTFLNTANNAEFERTLGYPFSDRLQFPSATSALEILEAHRGHLKAVLAGKPGVAPVICKSYDDLRASQDRYQLLKNAHRASPDFDYRAEWQKIIRRPLRPHEERMVDEVATNLTGVPPGDMGM
jgi:hypothetical protein